MDVKQIHVCFYFGSFFPISDFNLTILSLIFEEAVKLFLVFRKLFDVSMLCLLSSVDTVAVSLEAETLLEFDFSVSWI